MPARATWKGYLQINELNVPVKAFSACRLEPEIALHQLHRQCHQRIRQQKVCPQHGVVISDDIISGYEYAEGKHLALDRAELDQLSPEDPKAISVDCFVSEGSIDAVYHSGRTYYLVPESPPGQRPFCVLRDGMRGGDRVAIGRVVIAGNELLVQVRPLGRLLAMTVLEYPQRVRPHTDYETEVAGHSADAVEGDLMGQLITALTRSDLDLAEYRDEYIERLNELIAAKVAELQPAEETADAKSKEGEEALIAALRRSLVHARPNSRTSRTAKDARLPAESPAPGQRIRKSG